ncbi:MAG: Bug family tripartite tricarboxylate transporter substrate binding protein [Xanthobacteraceae bacterium]
MRTGNRYATLPLAVALFLSASTIAAHAETFPSRSVKIITDVGTGGTYDIFARALAEELNRKWNSVGVIIEPRPGGNAVIGNRACAEAPPDGYTICILSNQGLVANEFLYKKLPYSRDSFTPVMNLFYNTQVIVVSGSLNVKSLDELAALAKAKPGTLNYIVPGIFQRIFFDRFNKKYGTDLVAIPFKGGGDVLTGLLSGITPIAFIGGANFAQYVRDGKMVALAVDADQRSPLFPDAPTLAQAGYTERMTRTYLALMLPGGAPKELVTKIHEDVAAIMNEPGFRQRQIIDRGLEPVIDSTADFAKFLEHDRELTGAMVKESGVEPQ